MINKQGVAFKGFLRYCSKIGEKFYKKTGIRLKLTERIMRYPGNKPIFESKCCACSPIPSPEGTAVCQGDDG